MISSNETSRSLAETSYFTQDAPEHVTASGKGSWFLDSAWDDRIWRFKSTSVLEDSQSVTVDWGFSMLDGGNFLEPRYEKLLHVSKLLIGLIRGRSLKTGFPQRARTAGEYFSYLRELLRWMTSAGFGRFSDIGPNAVLQFRAYLANRPGVKRESLSPLTIQRYLFLLIYLYRFRDELDDGLIEHPFNGVSAGQIAGVRDSDVRAWPATPYSVAVPLIQGAIQLLECGSSHILAAREVYARAIFKSKSLGYGANACDNAATRDLVSARIVWPGRSTALNSIYELSNAVEMLYAACFTVISYLVGLRSSEILHLEAGCVKRRSTGVGTETVAVIVGAIFKRQAEYAGRAHEWVAPEAAVLAISVLEDLSFGHRASTGRPQLWLRRAFSSGATEWQTDFEGKVVVCSRRRIRDLLTRFGDYLDLPTHEGKKWSLSAHQGRKTFVRFAALRDGSSLFAIAEHLGHRERVTTDSGYVGSDYRLQKEIQAEVLEQSVSAWECMLAADGLAGRAGAEVLTKRPRFRGARLKQDLKSYARLLVDAGLVLGVCDWGYCVYRQETSACLGNAKGPNPARREPSACAGCKNFAVSDQHLPYWVMQVSRHEALLADPALPLQTSRIARSRLDEARTIIRAIDQRNHGGIDSGNKA